MIHLSSSVIRSALELWSRQEHVFQGVPLQPLPPCHVLTTDASTYEWGVICGPLTARGVWLSDQSFPHINFLELETVFLALKRFQSWLCGAHVLFQTHSTTVMHYLNRVGDQVQVLGLEGLRDYSLVAEHEDYIFSSTYLKADCLSQFRIENPR